MTHEIRVVTPIVTEGLRLDEHLAVLSDADTKVTGALLDIGPASIEGDYDEAFALPDTINKVIQAEIDGCAAAVIDCMGDPGVKAAREAVTIPVFGPCETSVHVAATLAHAFSVVTVLNNLAALFENMVAVYGTTKQYASTRSVDIPVLELEKDRDALVRALTREAVAAVEEDGAHAIIFGCTGMFGCAEAIEEGLKERGHLGIPVLDPTPVTVRYAASMVRSGLTHSKRTYEAPRRKLIKGFDIRQPVGIAAE
jgi:allantoin racemase